MREFFLFYGLYIYYLIKIVGRAGIHPTKIPKIVIRPLSRYLKYPYPYPSVYMWAGGRAGKRVYRIGRAGRVLRFFAHPYGEPTIHIYHPWQTLPLKITQYKWEWVLKSNHVQLRGKLFRLKV